MEVAGTDEFRDERQSKSVRQSASAPTLIGNGIEVSETTPNMSALTGTGDGILQSGGNLRGEPDETTIREISAKELRCAWKARTAEIEESSASEGTKITTHHVANIFRASVTTAEVTQEEITRVKKGMCWVHFITISDLEPCSRSTLDLWIPSPLPIALFVYENS